MPLDADLQDPPELIEQMVALWREGYDVIYATRKLRESDSWSKRATAHAWRARSTVSTATDRAPCRIRCRSLVHSGKITFDSRGNFRSIFAKRFSPG